MKRALTRVLLAVALCLSAGRGLAQNTDVVLAETLYNEGRRLVEEGKFQEACPKFAESYRIDPATGTLLNLAACQEALGRYASAWTQYQEAVIAARRDQRPDRVSYAQERLAAIEPKLSWLTIQVPVAARVEGLALTLDGVRIGEAAFGVATPIDAGVHHVEASAPGYRAWTEELSITKEGERYTLNVPALEPAPEEPAPPPPTDVQARPALGSANLPPDRDVVDRPLTAPFWVAAGLTAAATGAAVVTGVLYMDKKSEFEAVNNDQYSRATKEDRRELAERYRNLNTIATASAAAGAALTLVLYLTLPERRRSAAALAPWIGSDSAGVVGDLRF